VIRDTVLFLAIQFRSLKVNSGEFRRFEVAQTGGPRHTAAKNSQTDSPELSLNKRQVPLSAAHECGHAAMGMELPKLCCCCWSSSLLAALELLVWRDAAEQMNAY
jgi:hypothetical protein